MGEIPVPEGSYYGAQTARSLIHFKIGSERMPMSIIKALALIKKAAAETNTALGILSEEKGELIAQAAQEIMDGKFEWDFPLHVWQTGSGTQTNMNVNEVIANRANELAGYPLGSKGLIHPNDDVNKSQSSNDTFPTAMHIAAIEELHHLLFPAIKKMRHSLAEKSEEYSEIIKIGRTHLMDAVPLTLGQEFSGYVAQLDASLSWLERAAQDLLPLALGGTAVGTGINAPEGFAELAVRKIALYTDFSFVCATNKFAALAAHDPLVHASGSLKTLATALLKIANDLRWMGSGPRCGLQELFLPSNEPGSSIMPGKVNPTQCEAMTMVAIQVMANDFAISMGGSQGNFELNVFKPLIIYNFLNSVHLLSDSMNAMTDYLIVGLKPNIAHINDRLRHSLMLVTALAPKVGYDHAAKAAHLAFDKNISLKEACLELNLIDDEEFDRIIDPSNMIGREKL